MSGPNSYFDPATGEFVTVGPLTPFPTVDAGAAAASTGIGAKADAAATTDTGTFSLIALVKRLLQKLTAGLLVGGSTPSASDTFARPADTTAYTAGDAVGATASDTGTTVLRSLANIARVSGGSGYLTKFRLWTDQKTCVARFRVHFYTVAAPAAAVPGDNVPMTLLWANRAQRVGYVDLPAMTTETDSTNSTAAHTQDLTTRLAFLATDANLYYRIQALDAFTPANGQNFFLECSAEDN